MQKPSQLAALARRFFTGFGKGRCWRYIFLLGLGALVFGGLASVYYLSTPASYRSGFALTLPGSGPGSRVNLEQLGSADTNTASPFTSPSLSPTVQYKRLISSDRIRGRTAAMLGLAISELPSFRVQLHDQTPMIFVTLSAGSPDSAFAIAETLLHVFQSELDLLREEEREARDDAYRAALSEYENAVRAAREAVLDIQTQSGLISVDQFDTLVRHTDQLASDMSAHLDRATARSRQSRRLSELVGLPEDIAAHVLTLRGDPQFEQLRTMLAERASEIASLGRMFGPNHPQMREAVERHSGLIAAMALRGEALLGVEHYRRLRLSEINLDDERAGLLRQVVDLSSQAAGERAQAASLNTRIQLNRREIARLTPVSAELAARQRDHRVAETVYASAVARLDTARSDMFTAYPMAQILEAPGLPDRPSSPSLKIAVGAAIAGYLLYLMGVVLLWLRLPLIRLLWKIT